MRKIIVFLMCVFAVATSVIAETCEGHGGTLITAHVATDTGCDSKTCNGKTFCKSDKAMNWWSAFTWCESQGRTLAEFSSMCPGVSQAPAGTTGDCPNLQGKGDNQWVWSSLAYGSDNAVVVNLSSGAVNANTRYGSSRCALCE